MTLTRGADIKRNGTRMNRLITCALVLCGLGVALCGAASAQEHKPTKAEAEVIALLEAKSTASAVKLSLVDHVTLGALKSEGFERVFVTINPKKAYAVIGVCEETCTNLDISVYDDNGDVIDADFDPDASPVVFLQAGTSRTAKLKLFMAMKLCSAEPCVYGVGVYQVVDGKN
jgi:hypothetical protein